MDDLQLQCSKCGKSFTGCTDDIHTDCPYCHRGKLHDVTGFIDEQPEGSVDATRQKA